LHGDGGTAARPRRSSPALAVIVVDIGIFPDLSERP
jgi:hypothetical protein